VPPVHRVPRDIEGVTILVGADPEIETRNPEHVKRANEAHIPPDYRASMVLALELAGFRVVQDRAAPHDLVATLALRVEEDDGKVRQTYRCRLHTDDGTEVVQIDWMWPPGTYVDVYEVLDFATHNVATEIVSSRRLVAYLRAQRGASQSDAGAEK
jgi:hypothetical protein